MNIRNVRACCLPLLAAAFVACASESTDPETAEDDISVNNLLRLLRGKIDRSKVDPYNPWARTALGVGEEYRLAGEAEEFQSFAATANEMQRDAQSKAASASLGRTFHAKGHGCARGELTLDPSALSASARVGMFSSKARYTTLARFSNGSGDRQGDRTMDMRGLAIKIMNLRGDRIVSRPGDETATTQDFLMGNIPFAPASDARHMMAMGAALSEAGMDRSILGRFNGLVHVGSFLARDENVRIADFFGNHALPATKKHGSMLSQTFFTGTPNALGLTAGDPETARAKGAFKLMVKAGSLQNGQCTPVSDAGPSKQPDFLRTDLLAHFERESVCLELYIQLQQDGRTESIEDVSVEWSTPFTRVGLVTFAPGSMRDDDDAREQCERYSFTPWHTLADHRPLGNAQRARRLTLTASAKLRGADMTEPTE
jgi:hypothetical protein